MIVWIDYYSSLHGEYKAMHSLEKLKFLCDWLSSLSVSATTFIISFHRGSPSIDQPLLQPWTFNMHIRMIANIYGTATQGLYVLCISQSFSYSYVILSTRPLCVKVSVICKVPFYDIMGNYSSQQCLSLVLDF